MADRSDIIRRRLLRTRRQTATTKAVPDFTKAAPAAAKSAPLQAPIKQAPSPPVAPKAPKGEIKREKRLMEISSARRARFLKYITGLILLGLGGYVYLFRPAELAIISAFAPMEYIAFAPVLLGIILILYAEAKERGPHYYITQYRVVESWGLLRKKEQGVQLLLIESVKINQTFFQRILGIGDVDIRTSGGQSIKIKKIGNPGKVEAFLLSELNRTQRAKSMQPRR
ncbi:PH domain-containing protein [Candidatus Aenigmatarchaeota archaeon]